VNRARNHFLSGARFALYQDGGIHWRYHLDVVEQVAKFRAGSDQI